MVIPANVGRESGQKPDYKLAHCGAAAKRQSYLSIMLLYSGQSDCAACENGFHLFSRDYLRSKGSEGDKKGTISDYVSDNCQLFCHKHFFISFNSLFILMGSKS